MKILFYDVTTPIAYTDQTLAEQMVRGTEGSVIRVAHGLAPHHTVCVAQHCREKNNEQERHGVRYISLETAHGIKPDVVVLLRDQRYLQAVIDCFPGARRFFWMHNMPPRKFRQNLNLLKQYEIIAVSHFHKEKILKRLNGKWYQRLFTKPANIKVHVLYNPLDENLKPDASAVKPEQMIFTSSPYKGLNETLEKFVLLRKKFPEYRLLITASEKDIGVLLPENTHAIGSLSRPDLSQLIRESFCVFYPQTKRVETFGLVYAEANALGTPVLAHDFGAAREVLSDECQLVDGHDTMAVINKVKDWRQSRPKTAAKHDFALNQVVSNWLNILYI